MKRIFFILLVLVYSVCIRAYDAAPPSQLFPYPVAVVSIQKETLLCLPAYCGLLKGWALSASYSRPYGIDNLQADWTRCGFGDGQKGFSAGYERFGIPEYHEDRFSVSGGTVWKVLSVGTEAFYKKFSILNEISSAYALADCNVHAVINPLPFFTMGIRQDSVYSLFVKERQDILWPTTALGVGGSPMKGVFLSWNYTRTYYGAVNSFACSVHLIPHLSVSAGYSRETTVYALSTSVVVKNIIVSYGMNYHAFLGTSHKVGVSLSTDSNLFDPVNTVDKKIDPEIDNDVMIDLEECTLDDLLMIRTLDAVHAERIIRYREIFGPVTEKSLTQMGCDKKEIDAVIKHSTGLAEEDHSEKKSRTDTDAHNKVKPKNQQIKKALFIRLVEGGIPAQKALHISDSAMKSSIKEVLLKIDAMKELTEDEKKKAKKICGE
jgi:hypothetical protein